MKKILFSSKVILMVFLAHVAFAQSNLYMTKGIKKAYNNGTRSYDGAPGKAYFQNSTDYNISVSFDPVTRLIQGVEQITYTNNSPDSLKYIVLHLYSDLFKKGTIRKKFVNPDDVNDGVGINQISQHDVAIDVFSGKVRRQGTNLIITLPRPVPPNSSTEINISWEYIFQGKTNLREGMYHNSSFFIAFWYPKIAVYDDIDRWNRHVFNGEQEFYSEYGDFEVEITVPKDYLVFASGLLQNPEDVYSKKILKKYNRSKTSDEVINIVTEKDIKTGGLTAKEETNTWLFSADYIPDFSFVVTNSYLWDAASVDIGDKTVLINAVYYKGSEEFPEVAEITKKTLLQLSEIMGVDYPYPQMTAFNGEGGMEFPMMVNDGDMGSRNGALFVTAHEEGHTYFPFYVGTNEQKYGWMDEGLITFLPKVIEDSLSHDEGFDSFSRNIRTYSYYAGTVYDQPLMIPSDQLMGTTYMFASYGRSAVAFYVLKDILGEEVFKQCLSEFIQRWNGKHPTAYDLFYTFEDISKQDLGWFWKPWFFEFGYPDLSVKDFIRKDGKIQVKVENLGGFPVPVMIAVEYSDGSTETIYKSASIWKTGERNIAIDIPDIKRISKFEIYYVPDGNKSNNTLIIN